MKRMWSKNELKNLSTQIATIISTELISSLAVTKIDPPSSTTLTDEEIEKITSGAFIQGEFLGIKNPVLFPAYESAGIYRGLVISVKQNTVPIITAYYITVATKVISLYNVNSPAISLDSMGYMNGKQIPSYPANEGTFVLKCVNGTLTWVEEI